MGLIPRTEYPFIRAGVIMLGPFDSADFTTGDLLSSISLDSPGPSGSSITLVSSLLSTGGGGPGGGLGSSGYTSSLSSEVSPLTYASAWCPDRDMYIDAAWMRAKTISSDNMNRLRLLSVSAGQSVKTAWANRQFITSRAYGNIGDETLSSYESSLSGSLSSVGGPLVANTVRDLRVIPDQNRVPAFGMLVVLAEEVPDALVDLIIGIRYRECPM